jgi:hypothetical protein
MERPGRPSPVRRYVRYTPTLVFGARPSCPEAIDVANRKHIAARATREAEEDRQLSFVVREPETRSEPDKFALLIPPPRSPVSAVRRLDLAARWATDLGELAAELVAEGRLEVEARPAARTKERTR